MLSWLVIGVSGLARGVTVAVPSRQRPGLAGALWTLAMTLACPAELMPGDVAAADVAASLGVLNARSHESGSAAGKWKEQS